MEGYAKNYVAGMGIVCSIGKNKWDFLDALISGKSNFKKSILQLNNSQESYINSYVDDFIPEFDQYKVKDKKLVETTLKLMKRLPIALQITISSCMEAYMEAYDALQQICPERRSIILAGNNILENESYQLFSKYKDNSAYIRPSDILHCMDTNYIGYLSELFNFSGLGYTVGGASASGNVAIINALWMLRTRQADCCMVVGPAVQFSDLTIKGLKQMDAIGGKEFSDNPEKSCRPFDISHEGFIPSNAGACMIFVRDDLVASKPDDVFGVLGGAHLLHGTRLTEANVDAEIKVMKNALQDAGISSIDIGYINAHGTSTPLGDCVELDAIKQVFSSNKKQPIVNSTKGFTGHCMYSAGIVEAIATILQMKCGCFHKNNNLDTLINISVNTIMESRKEKYIQFALSNSFGFHGINTSIVINKLMK